MLSSLYTNAARRGTFAKQVQYALLWLRKFSYYLKALVTPIDEKLIIFNAFNGRSYCCSPKALYNALKNDERFNDYTFVWVFNQPENYQDLVDERTKLVTHHSKEYYRAYAKAGTWIVNAMLARDIPKRRRQTMVQCWHGTPLKRVRVDTVKSTESALDSHEDIVRKNKMDVRRYDYFLSPSRFATEKFITAFQLNELGKSNIIIEEGYPRNDRLHNFTLGDAKRIKQDLGIPSDKKVVLYAPTWRDDQFDDGVGFVYESPLDFEKLQRDHGDNYVVLFRAHNMIAWSPDYSAYKGFVYDVSDVDDINDLYIISDLLITDYSSVFFDYANLKRPMLFYMYDRSHYEKDLRGFYLPTDAVPGDIVTSQQQLTEKLQDLESYTKRTAKKVEQFSNEYNYLDDGHATERVIEEIFFNKK